MIFLVINLTLVFFFLFSIFFCISFAFVSFLYHWTQHLVCRFHTSSIPFNHNKEWVYRVFLYKETPLIKTYNFIFFNLRDYKSSFHFYNYIYKISSLNEFLFFIPCDFLHFCFFVSFSNSFLIEFAYYFMFE